MNFKLITMISIPICLFFSCKQDTIVKKYYKKNIILSDSIYFYCRKIKQETGSDIIIRETGIFEKKIEAEIQIDPAKNYYHCIYFEGKNEVPVWHGEDDLLNKQLIGFVEREDFKALKKLIRESRYDGVYSWNGGVFISYDTSSKDISGNSNIGIAYYYDTSDIQENKFLIKIQNNVYIGHFAY